LHIQSAAVNSYSAWLHLNQKVKMKEKDIVRIQKKIHAFIGGRLNQHEIDELWIEFLKDPNWYDIFETELHLRSIARKYNASYLF